MTDTLELLALKDVVARTKIGKSKLYEWMREGTFPKSHEIAPNIKRWRSDEVDAWIRERAPSAPDGYITRRPDPKPS